MLEVVLKSLHHLSWLGSSSVNFGFRFTAGLFTTGFDIKLPNSMKFFIHDCFFHTVDPHRSIHNDSALVNRQPNQNNIPGLFLKQKLC